MRFENYVLEVLKGVTGGPMAGDSSLFSFNDPRCRNLFRDITWDERRRRMATEMMSRIRCLVSNNGQQRIFTIRDVNFFVSTDNFWYAAPPSFLLSSTYLCAYVCSYVQSFCLWDIVVVVT